MARLEFGLFKTTSQLTQLSGCYFQMIKPEGRLYFENANRNYT